MSLRVILSLDFFLVKVPAPVRFFYLVFEEKLILPPETKAFFFISSLLSMFEVAFVTEFAYPSLMHYICLIFL